LKYKNIIFDFDGVLAESLHIKTQAFYQMYEQYGKEVAQQVVKHHKANGGMSRYEKFPYYHKNFLNIDLALDELTHLTENFSKMVIDKVIMANEVKGALWFLKKYKDQCRYWIVSATPTNEIVEIAAKRNIADYFFNIFGSPDKKPDIVQKIKIKNSLNKNETVFLGDAMSDFEAAEKNNIDFLLRSTVENKTLFKSNNIKRFSDFYDLDKMLNSE
jgi:phosphoglycolate phosphatase-like HAD superfamily hydrolase